MDAAENLVGQVDAAEAALEAGEGHLHLDPLALGGGEQDREALAFVHLVVFDFDVVRLVRAVLVAHAQRNAEGTVIAGSLDDAIESRDVWTFSRNITARDPNWLLDETDEG